MNAAIQALRDDYGGVESFLTNELQLAQSDIDDLKKMYLH